MITAPRASASSALVLLFSLLAPAALATVAPGPETGVLGPRPGLSEPPFIIQATSDERFRVDYASQDEGFQGFLRNVGGKWMARHDRRTGRPALIWGSGLPWLPGRGNALEWKQLGLKDPSDAQVRAYLKTRALSFLEAHPLLFRVPAGVDLVLDPLRTVSLEDETMWQVWFGVEREGVRMKGASVFFRVGQGNLVQLGSANLSDGLGAFPATPVHDAAAAMNTVQLELSKVLKAAGVALQSTGAELSVSEWVDSGTLQLRPWSSSPRTFAGIPGQGVDHRLAWRVSLRLNDRLETWVGLVDALSGRLLALWDDNKYECEAPALPQGRLVGGVFLGAVEEVPESMRGMPYARVENGGPIVTDYNGLFPHDAAQPASAGLNGRYFDVSCDGCNTPNRAFVSNPGSGALNLGTGGPDQNGNGWSTRPERNCFYHLGVVRQLATKHLDDAAAGGFIERTTPALVNIAQSCNAFWNGNSVNFFRSSGQCNNTGDIADVMQHEWGHGLDQFTGRNGDGARGEGLSDVVAFLSTHDPRLGPYFVRGNANGIRNADEAVSGRGVLTYGNVADVCPGGGGPAGAEVHCEGELFSQTWWHLARIMREKSVAAGGSEAAGWFATERLFFQSLPLSDTYVPDQATSTYDAVVFVDDDDGNLANGVPNGAEIDEAFEHHEVASTPLVGDSADCTPPASPTITLTSRLNTSTGLWQVEVNWTAVPAAVQYDVYRNDQAGVGADVPVATMFAPTQTFIDDNVTDGVTYTYRVTAFDASGCASIVENEQATTVAALLSLSVSNLTVNDSLGNGNGVPDAGERIILIPDAYNGGRLDATNVVGTLTTTNPSVLVVDDSADYGDIPVGATVPAQAQYFTVDIDAGATCDESLGLKLSLDATEGCVASGLAPTIGCEAPFPRPRLAYQGLVIGDDPASGGFGNGNGFIDPGEVVRLPMDLSNFGNAAATTVRGSLNLAVAPPGLTVGDPDASWPDIATSGTETSGAGTPPHFALVVPEDAPCGALITVVLIVDYEGPSGSYQEIEFIELQVGQTVETALFFDDFEGGDNGFRHDTNCGGCNPQDDWHHLAPTGASDWDPLNAYSGDLIWGNDLGGDIGGNNGNGDYRRNVDNYLESPQIDARGTTGVLMSYQRWLTVENGEFDRARILVDGNLVWRNEVGGSGDHHIDTEWIYHEIDISDDADDNRFRIRFEMQSDGGLEFGGWNLDDLRVFTRDQTCDAVVPPADETDCDDGIDNDRDGDTDCEDSDCALVCPETDCSNGADDDGDGDTDCEDSDCADQCTESICDDGLDNDSDGDVDCDDADCANQCPEVICDDGLDDDGDGDIDCDDADCADQCPEVICDDGLDDDGDGDIDCDDADCADQCPEVTCDDGLDNDSDGDIDCDDTDCADQCPEVICDDGLDDDSDGDVDCEDADCVGSPVCERGNCDDGLDNDGDGPVDCADSDCDGDTACAPRLAINRQASFAPDETLSPRLSVLNDPACSTQQFTLCTDGPDDELIDGELDGMRLVDEGALIWRVLWFYQHSDATTTMRLRRDGNDIVLSSN